VWGGANGLRAGCVAGEATRVLGPYRGPVQCCITPLHAYTLTPLEGGWGPSAGRFIFFSSRPLQGAQYSGALRHCTLTPLHPWRGAGGLRLADLFFSLLALYRGHSTVGHYAIARLHPYTPAGRFEPSLARDFFFLSSRPLQGAQYSGALRHCTLTPLHPCALFS
jgi:hypothetical protein